MPERFVQILMQTSHLSSQDTTDTHANTDTQDARTHTHTHTQITCVPQLKHSQAVFFIHMPDVQSKQERTNVALIDYFTLRQLHFFRLNFYCVDSINFFSAGKCLKMWSFFFFSGALLHTHSTKVLSTTKLKQQEVRNPV